MPRHDLTNEQILADLESSDPVVVLRAVGRTLPGLRSEVRTARVSWRFTAVVVVIAIGLGGWLIYRTNDAAHKAQDAVDELVATRASSRAGLCAAINDMRTKHNHFVQTAIDERQALIDSVNQGNTTAEQKAASTTFFQAQIENYRTDLLATVNCDDPAALAALFTKPGG